MLLTQANLTKLSITPGYDRTKLKPGIVHIGVGNFHRAHMATYLDNLFQLENDTNNEWAIVGAGVMLPFDAERRKTLQQQDWLNTLVERDGEMQQVRIIESMIDFLPVQEDHAPLRNKLVDPAIKIVSLTVTEGGYYLNPATNRFDPKNPKIRADAANCESPKTVFGLIVQALKKRREVGYPPFTVMSCDNIPHNGDVAREVVVGLAGLTDKEHAQWIQKNVGFPNSMVDRITPATTNLERQLIKDQFGYDDDLPICCEPYRQWVLEDSFSQGRPNLEKVGVKFVSDVTPYENMKIRILNGGHASLCYPAALLGIQYVHEAMEHPIIGPFLDTVERNEIIPGVGPVPDTSLTEYWKLIAKRFSNPTLGDRIDRNCADGANRQPKFILPPALDSLRDGREVDGLALVSALWCRYCQGKAEDGTEIVGNDRLWERLHETALRAGREDPTVWVDMEDIYGEVGQDPKFRHSFAVAFRTICEEGVEAAMKKYIEKFV